MINGKKEGSFFLRGTLHQLTVSLNNSKGAKTNTKLQLKLNCNKKEGLNLSSFELNEDK